MHSAISFLCLNDLVCDYDHIKENTVGILKMEMAATAILMHDMQKVYGESKETKAVPYYKYEMKVERPHIRLSFLKDPVSFVVALADQLQEYGRMSCTPDIKTKGKEDGMIVLALHQNVEETKLELKDSNDVTITFLYKKDSQVAESINKAKWLKDNKFIPKLNAEYFEPSKGYLDYKGLFSRITLETGFAERPRDKRTRKRTMPV